MLNVVILAAGQGKRMHSDLPKVLRKLAGRPMLSHVLEAAHSLAPSSVCVVYGHGGEQVRETYAEAGFRWALQSPQQGTGHAVMQALPEIDPALPTLILYGDVPLISPATLSRLLGVTKAGGLGLLTVMMDEPKGYGRIIREKGHVVRIVEERDATEEERRVQEVNTGIMLAPAGALHRWLPKLKNNNTQGEYYLTDIVPMALSEGMAIHAVQPDHLREVQGVNSRSQLAALERAHQLAQAGQLMGAGVGLADPARLDVRGKLVCGRDVHIDVNCIFEGDVTLGDGVSVGAHCVLKNTVVEAGSQIAPYSHLEEAHVGARARIGPYARLRPGARLAADVHVGNFVEIKNTSLGQGSKANHLAYVGDATVGENVNIGAGTITCNYDGVNKHRTVIEDGAFIGSDSQLVAPVTVGKNATLGAGTTLTKDAPADQLTVSRSRQVSVPGWKRPVKTKK